MTAEEARRASETRAITAFLEAIGIPVEARTLDPQTFLPGVTIEAGRVLYDPARLRWPGDLLHEAGHLAVMPAAARASLAGAVDVEAAPHAGEAEATAWAFAAVKAIGLPMEALFHEGGYHGKSGRLAFTYASGCYPGAAGLVAAGMALAVREAAAAGLPPYPAMLRWLRD